MKGKAAMKIKNQWKTYNWRTIQEACTAKNQFLAWCQCSRGVTRLDGTRGKKQLWRPHVRTWGLSETNVLYWRKHLQYCWDFRRPHGDSAPREFCPFAPLFTPLQCSAWFRNRSVWYQGRNEVRWRPGKMQIWRPHIWIWGLMEANLLYWRKYLWYC